MEQSATGHQQSLGHKLRMVVACFILLPVPAPPIMQKLLPAAFLFLVKGRTQLAAGMESSGSRHAYASSSHFFLFECSHDAQSRNTSPESTVILNKCQQTSRSRPLVGEKKSPLLVGFLVAKTFLTNMSS